MRRPHRRIETQLTVVGTGIAGFAAALFARARGLDVAQVGHSGALAYTTGYLDLLGVADGRKIADPWAGLDALRMTEPGHPFGRLANADIRAALDAFIGEVNAMGLGYTPAGAANLTALLPYGVTKPTLSLPETMWPGAAALAERAPALIVDFAGLQGFSAAEFAANMAAVWPGLATARLAFPGMESLQVFPEPMARALETRETRAAFVARLRPHLGAVTHVGLPAILGVHRPDTVRAALEAELGVTLFEIPTIPPGVPGIRLRELFERHLPGRGVALEPNLKAAEARLDPSGITLALHGPMEDLDIRAEAVVLATGRFLSGGLRAERSGIRETLFGLPVAQPDGREAWFRPAYFDPRGHPVNRLGLTVDDRFRPLDAAGAPVHPRLHAAGAVLAGQDWARSRSGAGLAIASAWAAVNAAGAELGSSPGDPGPTTAPGAAPAQEPGTA
ncbi:MAG: glycerol-3-phosphate dehydrogenase subunit GlpB [Maritimibacter sp.]|nr:glycerol-3-phosphate dehydrogenase subunit GlpB [Maritimibacter sp.]